MDNDQLHLMFQTDEAHTSVPGGWRASRQKLLESYAQERGLPIGRHVRISFHNGPPCEGMLLLDEDLDCLPKERNGSNLQLAVGRIRFTAGDIASCIAVED